MKTSAAKEELPDSCAPSIGRKMGRPKTLGDDAERISFFITSEDRELFTKLSARSAVVGRKPAVKLTYIFREGGRRFMQEIARELGLESDGTKKSRPSK